MWQRLIKFTRDYFYVSHNDAKGVLVLLILMSILIATVSVYRNTKQYIPLYAQLDQTHEDTTIAAQKTSEKPITYRTFDPNEETDLESLGISAALVNRIKNYTRAGGRFKQKTDLLKIYGFPDSLFKRLEPYIEIQLQTNQQVRFGTSSSQPYNPRKQSDRPIELIEPIDLNTADSVLLIKMKGIGGVFASRIIKFRTRLGGFHDKNQIYDVYGIPPETINHLLENSYLSTTVVAQIDLNTITFKELLKHPYLEYEDVKKVFDYKNKYGGFNQVEDLKKYQLLSDSLYIKIVPYLKI